MRKSHILPLLVSCVELISCDKVVKSPVSALVDDDPCLRDPGSQSFQCGTALLQSGNRRLPPRKAAKRGHGNEARALLEEVLETAEKASRNASFLDQLRHLIVSDPRVHRAHGVQLLQEHVVRISACDAELRLRQESDSELTGLHDQWLHLHKACEADELVLQHKVDSCQTTAESRQNQTWGCVEQQRLLRNKTQECLSIRAAMRSTGCARASQAAESCRTYTLCRTRMSVALKSATKAVKAADASEHDQARWLTFALFKCLQKRLSDVHFNHSDALLAARDCKALAEKEAEADQLKDLPTALECNTRSEDHGLCVEDQEFESTSRDFSAQALGADLAKEVAGVSFMQEGIERADALPGHFHKALTDSILSIPMLLAMLTMLMLWARCTVPLTSREQKEPTTPASVDAWCVQGQATDTECEGKWLCHELIVPRSSKCAVTMPRMLKAGPWTALVSDKMGQCMFKACAAEADEGLRINLARQDDAVLAACKISFEGHGSCQILRGDESPFALLEWEALQARASWLRWRSAGPGSFVLRSRLGVLLQVTGGFDGEDGRLHVQDARKQSVAEATLCRGAGSLPDTLHVQVVSSGATDLGLVLAVLLAVDRLQASRTSS